MGEADDDATFELVEVEGVSGMAHAEEDEVAGVDCVRDLLLAEEVEVFGDLAGAGGDGDVAEDLGGEAAAEGGGFYGDGEGLPGGGVREKSRFLHCGGKDAASGRACAVAGHGCCGRATHRRFGTAKARAAKIRPSGRRTGKADPGLAHSYARRGFRGQSAA